MAAVMDFEGTREKLREQIEQDEAELAAWKDRLGELALDCELGDASKAELEKARAKQAALTNHIAELQAALGKVDDREADHAAREAEKQRQADDKRLTTALERQRAAGKQVVSLLAQLVAACEEGTAAEREGIALARKLDEGLRARTYWTDSATQLIGGRLHSVLPSMPYINQRQLEPLSERLQSAGRS